MSDVEPLANIANLSSTAKLVVETIVWSPFTVKSPVIVRLSLIVVSDVEWPIEIAIPLFAVPIDIAPLVVSILVAPCAST